MEKKFIQSTLFATTILVVYAMVSPPMTLSAQSEKSFDESAPVRKGVVIKVDEERGAMLVDFDGVSVPIILNASTTVTSANGSETQMSFFRDGSAIYVFGDYHKEDHSIQAEKIIMRNKPITDRTLLVNRTDSESAKNTERKGVASALYKMSLTAK